MTATHVVEIVAAVLLVVVLGESMRGDRRRRRWRASGDRRGGYIGGPR